MTQFVKLDDVCQTLLDYIHSEDFKKVPVEDPSGFMAGIGMAGVVIMAKCDRYVMRDDFTPTSSSDDSTEGEC